jgi:hypothetical protein
MPWTRSGEQECQAHAGEVHAAVRERDSGRKVDLEVQRLQLDQRIEV